MLLLKKHELNYEVSRLIQRSESMKAFVEAVVTHCVEMAEANHRSHYQEHQQAGETWSDLAHAFDELKIRLLDA